MIVSLKNTAKSLAWVGFAAAIFVVVLVLPGVKPALAVNLISSKVYQDISPANGAVDTILVTMDENVASCTYDAPDWVVSVAGTIGVTAVTNATCVPGTPVITLTVTSGAGKTGGATSPTITYTQANGTADSFVLASGAMTNKTINAMTDGAAPFVLSALYLDSNTDGEVDKVQFTTSTDLGIACTAFTGNTDFTVGTTGTVALASAAGDTCASNGTSTFTITLATVGANNTTGGAVAPVVTYTQPGNGVEDGALNDVPTAAGVTVTDGASPIILSMTYLDANSNGTVDTVRLATSADVGISCVGFTGGTGFTVGTAGTVVLAANVADSCSTNGTSRFDVALGTLGASGITGGSTAPVASYHLVGGAVADAAANTIGDTLGVTVADGAAPVPLTADYIDANHNGTVDAVEVNFSADTGLAVTYNAADWTFPVAGTVLALSDTGASAAANKITVTVSATASATGGGSSPTILYTNTGSANRVHDTANNATATLGGAITVTDSAAPVVVSTSPVASETGVDRDASIVFNFSETMATNAGGVCTFTTSPDPTGFATASPVAIEPTADTHSVWSAGLNNQAKSRATLAHAAGLYDYSASVTVTIANCYGADAALMYGTPVSVAFTVRPLSGGSGGSGGGSSYTPTPSIMLNSLNGGGTYAPGATVSIAWTSADGAFVKYRVSYSADVGATWTTITDNATTTSASWTIPNIATSTGKVKVEGYNSVGTLLASTTSSSVFTITGSQAPATGTQETQATPAPEVDPTVHGSYTATAAKDNNPSIMDDKRLVPVSSANCTAGDLVKASLPSVYYCGADGKRYVFVNDKAFFSWYADFSTVKTISDETLSSIPIGGNITYRPGSRMVKIVSDPRVYAVARGGVLRWVSSEAIAKQLYGDNWNQMIDDVSDSFFVNYTVGSQI